MILRVHAMSSVSFVKIQESDYQNAVQNKTLLDSDTYHYMKLPALHSPHTYMATRRGGYMGPARSRMIVVI